MVRIRIVADYGLQTYQVTRKLKRLLPLNLLLYRLLFLYIGGNRLLFNAALLSIAKQYFHSYICCSSKPSSFPLIALSYS